MRRLRVLYFAAVRDLVGVSEEELDLPASVSRVSDLIAELELAHPRLRGQLGGVRFAVNEEFAQDADPVRPGDVVALIPPVAGG